MPSARTTVFSRAGIYCSALLLAVAVVAAWANSFRGPFVLDDIHAIAENATIQHFQTAFAPPSEGQTVSGRPLVNISFALNWAVGGVSVTGYHALNLAIHSMAALALFGVARRTLLSPALAPRFAAHATPLGCAIALWWMLHPLQTESVTYLSQRAESLAGLWLLLTLYAAIRGVDSPKSVCWTALAIITCLLGMASKETMFAAPLLVLLHDRTFFAGTFGRALRRRPGLYTGLAATWLLLGWLVWRTGNRGTTAGFGLGITPWHYLLTQCAALVHYLRLALWPAPLVLDYGFTLITAPREVWLQGLGLLALLAATIAAIGRLSPWGFLGAWFFLLLAPSSSIVPVATQTIAEHRMYLPLAAAMAAGVVTLWCAMGRRAWLTATAGGLALGALTVLRNNDYENELSLWRDTVMKRPQNARAHNNLGNVLKSSAAPAAALAEYETALRLKPDFMIARINLANLLQGLNRTPEAIAQYEEAIRLNPRSPEAHHNLAAILERAGRLNEAVAHYQAALPLEDKNVAGQTHFELANTLVELKRLPESLPHYEAALRTESVSAVLHSNLGTALYTLGRIDEARIHFEAAVYLDPTNADARLNLGVALLALGETPKAAVEFAAALRLRPDFPIARANLERARQALTPSTVH